MYQEETGATFQHEGTEGKDGQSNDLGQGGGGGK